MPFDHVGDENGQVMKLGNRETVAGLERIGLVDLDRLVPPQLSAEPALVRPEASGSRQGNCNRAEKNRLAPIPPKGWPGA